MFNRRSAAQPSGSEARNSFQSEVVERRYERFDIFINASLDSPTHGMRGVQQTACIVRNISQGGAALHVGPAFESIPDMFLLDIPMSDIWTITVNSQVVGRKGGMLHVKFLRDLDEKQIEQMRRIYIRPGASNG